MKSTLATLALAMTVAEAQWTENVYGRRTNHSSTGSWGPGGQQQSFNRNYQGTSGNFDEWGRPKSNNAWGGAWQNQQIVSALGTRP